MDLLQTFPHTEGTITFLILMDFIHKAYVKHDTLVKDRLYYATYVVSFLRIWRQWLIHNKLNLSSFITSNCYECLEINLVLLLRLTINGKAENIFEQNSQVDENFFRKVRSYTGVESTIVNCTMLTFMSRVHKICYEEKAMKELGDVISFPTLEKRNKYQKKNPELLSDFEICEITNKAISDAQRKAKEFGMNCREVEIEKWLKPVSGRRLDENVSSGTEVERNLLRIDDNLDLDDDRDVEYSINIDDMQFLNENSNDSFLNLTDDRKVHKKSLVWNLQQDRINISKDIRSRFIPKKAVTVTSTSENKNHLYRSTIISKGDYVVIKLNQIFYFGCVLNFRYVDETAKCRTIHYNDFVEVDSKDEKIKHKIGMCIEPMYELRHLEKVPVNNINKLYLLNDYFCHAKHNVDFSSPEVKDLMNNLLKTHLT